MTKAKLYGEEDFATWDELYQYYVKEFSEGHKQWIFKGHAKSNWHLRTTLERAFLRYFGETTGATGKQGEDSEEQLSKLYLRISSDGVGDEKRPLSDIEKGLLRDFKRKCHHHVRDVPRADNTLEWLTLMQHHGAPTRLLDFTYSFFVALYFAIEEAEEECAVWAIDSQWLSNKNKNGRLFDKCDDKAAYAERTTATTSEGQEKFFQRFFWQKARPRVEVLNTYRLNQRLIIQQGVFLCPGDISVPFMDNLDSLPKDRLNRDKLVKLKLKLSRQERTTVLQHLHRMNITRATLFPGLDGFAKSLENLLIFPDILRPDVD